MTAYQPASFSRFGDVAVRLSVELGRTDMPLREVLSLGEGSTVSLNRLTDELLDVTANGHVIARGEVIAECGRFALRIVSLVGEDGLNGTPAAGLPPRAEPEVGSQPFASAAPIAGGSAEAGAAPAAPEPPSPAGDALSAALDDLL